MRTLEQRVADVVKAIESRPYVCESCDDQADGKGYWIPDTELGFDLMVCEKCYSEAGNITPEQEAELDRKLEAYLRDHPEA